MTRARLSWLMWRQELFPTQVPPPFCRPKSLAELATAANSADTHDADSSKSRCGPAARFRCKTAEAPRGRPSKPPRREYRKNPTHWVAVQAVWAGPYILFEWQSLSNQMGTALISPVQKNTHRVHASLNGDTPPEELAQPIGAVLPSIQLLRKSHCRELRQLPVAT